MEACVYRVYKIEPDIGLPYASPARNDWSTQFDELKLAVRLNRSSLSAKYCSRVPLARQAALLLKLVADEMSHLPTGRTYLTHLRKGRLI